MPTICQFATGNHHEPDSSEQVTWVDIDASDPEDLAWLMNQADIDDRAKSLFSDGTNVTRREKLHRGLFVAMGGLRRGDRQGQLVSILMLIEPRRFITVHTVSLLILKDIRSEIDGGQGPRTPIEFFARLAVRYAESLENSILQISTETDDVEDRVLAAGDDPPLGALDELSYKAFQVRRQLVPLRNMLNFMAADQSLEIDRHESQALAAASEQVIRYLEGLNECRERAQMLRNQVESHLAATMTRVSYNLTIVATVFLPLSFITGLLGMNVAGTPEEHNPWGFWLVCAGMVVVAVASWLVLRWRRWV